eukprot:384008_1
MASISAGKDVVKLYSYWRSSCSYRVRIALSLKNIKYEYSAVNLVKGDQAGSYSDDVNPSKMVPALVIDGHTLNQSMSIIEYLDETRPEPPLMPKDPHSRSIVRSLTQTIGCDIQPVQNLRVLKKHGLEHKLEWGKHFIEVGFEALEKQVVKTAGKYCFGDEISTADLFLVPQIYNALRFQIDMDQFPTLNRIGKLLNEHPAFVEALPENQPDAPVGE